jgi:hypothetical protein
MPRYSRRRHLVVDPDVRGRSSRPRRRPSRATVQESKPELRHRTTRRTSAPRPARARRPASSRGSREGQSNPSSPRRDRPATSRRRTSRRSRAMSALRHPTRDHHGSLPANLEQQPSQPPRGGHARASTPTPSYRTRSRSNRRQKRAASRARTRSETARAPSSEERSAKRSTLKDANSTPGAKSS